MADDTWTVDDHLTGKPDGVRALYRRLVELIELCGPFTYRVTKTGISFKGSRRGFAGAQPGGRSLDGYLDLQREIHDPRILRASPYTSRLFVHHFRLRELGELDEEFAGWVCEAYDVGAGRHLERGPQTR